MFDLTPNGRRLELAPQCAPFFFVFAQTTAGDAVHTYVGPKGLRALFGPVDTPTEAWLVLVAEHAFEGLACGEPEWAAYRTVPGGHELRGSKVTSRCQPFTQKQLTYRVDTDGKTRLVQSRTVAHDPERCIVSGRRPPGLCAAADQAWDLPGYLARATRLEAASVDAFAILERELGALQAPAAILARVRAAQHDERDHAKRMAQLAQRFGAHVMPVQVAPRPLRTRLELALDNAREGCVRELHGALVARFQACRAQDRELRAHFVQIANDELRHAALSWSLAAWLEQGLSRAQRRRVAAERSAALTELRAQLSEPDLDLLLVAGLPALREAMLLADAVEGWVGAYDA